MNATNNFPSDIVAEVPWNCGGRDCPVGWHMSNYWLDHDGYTVDKFADGDHDPIDEVDLPSPAEIDEACNRYYRHVIETGTDPLEQFYIGTPREVEQVWQVRFTLSIVGVVLNAYRRGGRGEWIDGRKAPDHLAGHLCCVKRADRWVYDPMPESTEKPSNELRRLLTEDPGCRVMRGRIWLKAIVRVKARVQRSEKVQARLLRQAARKALGRGES